MCKYCRLDENEEHDSKYFVDGHPVLREKRSFNLGSGEMYIDIKEHIDVLCSVFGKGELWISLWAGDNGDALEYNKIVKINYCPFCGKRLSGNVDR